ncbi:hypothetical protein FB451DRAFT_621090 [Mycena latifolia]|nr:hypothetical protein FB451DRAFT_621090 [Mycena latifolia]
MNSPSARSSLSSESTLSVESMSSDSATLSSLSPDTESPIESPGNVPGTESARPLDARLSGSYSPIPFSILVSPAVDSEVVRQGWASMREIGSSATWVWDVRWLVLSEEALAFHKSENSPEDSSILLRDIGAVVRTDLKHHCLLLESRSSSAGLYLSLKTEEELRGWQEDLAARSPGVGNPTDTGSGEGVMTWPVEIATGPQAGTSRRPLPPLPAPFAPSSAKRQPRWSLPGYSHALHQNELGTFSQLFGNWRPSQNIYQRVSRRPTPIRGSSRCYCLHRAAPSQLHLPSHS